MWHASDFALGVVTGQKSNNLFYMISYLSKTLNDAQLKHTTTVKEVFGVVYAFEKFRSYLVGSKVIVFTHHATNKYLMTKRLLNDM